MSWLDLLHVLGERGLLQTPETPGDRAVGPIAGLSADSRAAGPGQAFVALKGQRADGTSFVRAAIERGAVAVVSEQPRPGDVGASVPWAQVTNARLALAYMSAAIHGDPSAELRVVGITGTNGKTTTAALVASILEAAGLTCGILGTVAYRIGDEIRDAPYTTPEAPELQRLLREMVGRGCAACAMEVSSHSLALHRVDGVRFAAGVFTNLTRDHLDFHGDMESYFKAKRRLFEMLPREAPSLINADDPRAPSLIAMAGRPVTYAINHPADITPGPLAFSLDGLLYEVRTPRGRLRVRSALVGRPNVSNILAAVATSVALDVPFDAIERGVEQLKAVPGRFQVVSGKGDEVTVVVDYAHTDDALRQLLETARPLARGRLITLFGCGGERDRSKRPLMGAVAERLSDLLVITSDNPRGEDPAAILEEIRLGLTPALRRDEGKRLWSIVDRREAVQKAVSLARPGDLVLVAGKGHEKTQVIGDRVLPFDDVSVAREALARRRANSGVL